MHDIHYGQKRKSIKKQLRNKLEDWISSIEDVKLRESVKRDVIVTGGSIASMLLGDPVNDYDVYFKTKETTIQIAKYYVDKFNGTTEMEVKEGVTPYTPYVTKTKVKNIKGVEEDRVMIYIKSAGIAAESQGTYSYFEQEQEGAANDFIEEMKENDKNKEKYRPVFLSENAITLSNQIQLVIRFFGSVDEVHNNYDFAHAKSYYDYDKDNLYLNPHAMECILSRTLIYEGSLYPIASMFRMKKFINRGWRISAGQMLKIMWQISELDLTDREILKEQLTGVDFAYLYQLIIALSTVDTEMIDSTYVAAIIDKIFSEN